MAWIKDFTSPDGAEHKSAYWKITLLDLNRARKKGVCTFLGYISKEAYEAGKSPVIGSGISVEFSPKKEETIKGTRALPFDDYFAVEKLAKEDSFAQCYLASLEYKNIWDGAKFVSFFEGAKEG